MLSRRQFLATSPAVLSAAAPRRSPNLILMLCDDLGAGDLGCYGSSISTPNLDRMAAEGARFTNALSANPVCSPSRAALLTGRYPTRVGVPRVLFPQDTTGLSLEESTLANTLKQAGYRTACVGKWHLGHQPAYLPTSRGFDSYFGIPYSNDMTPPVLLRNTETVEPVADQDTLTARYTAEAVRFIEEFAANPFFLYFPQTFPHIPLHASTRFRGSSPQGLYGDVIRELDWSMGEVLATLKRRNLDRDTLVLFTSDNGPWYQGSAGGRRGRKGSTGEGGVRVPLLARQPGFVRPAVHHSLVSLMDIVPTFTTLAGTRPARPSDGVDIAPVLTGRAREAARDLLLYFDDWNLQCVRRGPWKLHLSRHNTAAYMPAPAGGRVNLPLLRPELYNIDADPDESYDVAERHPDLVRDLKEAAEAAIKSFPEEVRTAYAATLARPATNIPAGAQPQRRQ